VHAGEPVTPGEALQHAYFLAGVWREWENSHYQFEQGLFDRDEFEPRINRWISVMRVKANRDAWLATRMNYSPSFRAEVDRIIARHSDTAEASGSQATVH
jgi:hypothetical protein